MSDSEALMSSNAVKPRRALWLALTWLFSYGAPAAAIWLCAKKSADPQSTLVILAALVLIVGPFGCAAALLVTVRESRKKSITRASVVSLFAMSAVIGVFAIAAIIAIGFMIVGAFSITAVHGESPSDLLGILIVPPFGALLFAIPALFIAVPFAIVSGTIASILGFTRSVKLPAM